MEKRKGIDLEKAASYSDKLGGFWLRDLLPTDVLRIVTQHSTYRLTRTVDGYLLEQTITSKSRIKTHGPALITGAGSTWGGSAIRLGFVGIGMFLEYHLQEPGKPYGVYTTSEIQDVILNPGPHEL